MTFKNFSDSILDRLEHRKPIRQHVCEFAYIFAIIAFAICAYYLYSGSKLNNVMPLVLSGAILIVLGRYTPLVLYPFWKAWMFLALALGFVVTNIVLFIMWLGVFVPIALLLKIIGKHVMDLSFDRSQKSYWNDRDIKYNDFKLLERQF